MGMIDRVRTIRWLRPAIAIATAGIIVLIAARTVAALSAHGDQLNALAGKATIVGTALAAAGAATSVAAFALSRLSGNVTPLSAPDLLKKRVGDYEDGVWKALLGSMTPADVAYVANETRYRNAGSSGVPDGHLTGIGDYYRNLAEQGVNRLLILGKPGAGKTVLAIGLILQLLREPPRPGSASGIDGKIPVRFNLAGWTVGTSLASWLAGKLTSDYGIPPDAADDLVAKQTVLPVFEGLDEMDPEPSDHAGGADNTEAASSTGLPRAAAFLAELDSYSYLGEPIALVLTCRQNTYNRLREAGSTIAAHQITILDLDATLIRSYLHTRYRDTANPRRQSWDQVLDRLDQADGEAARRVLATPLRLLLATTAADAGRAPKELLAAGVGEAPSDAEKRIDTDLLAKFIPAATRLTVRRSPSGISQKHYDPDKVTHWMQHLALHLQWQAQQVTKVQAQEVTKVGEPPLGMSGISLVPHLLWPVGGRRLVWTVHIALAVITAGATAFLVAYDFLGPPTVWLQNIQEVLHGEYSLRITIGQVVAAIAGVSIVPLCALVAASAWPRPSLAPIRIPVSSRLKGGLTVGLIVGLLGALVPFLAIGLSEGLKAGLVAALVLGLAILLSAGLAAGLGGELESWRPEADLAGPYDGLRWDRVFSLATAFLAALAVLIASRWLTHHPTSRPSLVLATALVLLLTGWLLFGEAWWRYALGIGCAAIRRRLPIRLKKFMTWACDSGLLRVAGTAYQFRHRELQTWLIQDTRDQAHQPEPALSRDQKGTVA
jgi:hypothetical protein